MRPRWRSTGRRRRPAQSRPGPRQHRQDFLASRGMTAPPAGEESSTTLLRRNVEARWSSARSAHHRGRMRAVPSLPERQETAAILKVPAGRPDRQPPAMIALAVNRPVRALPRRPAATGKSTHQIGYGRDAGSAPAAQALYREEGQGRKRDQSVPLIRRTHGRRGRKEGKTEPCALMTTLGKNANQNGRSNGRGDHFKPPGPIGRFLRRTTLRKNEA